MTKRFIAALGLVILPQLALAAEICPLGPRDDHLTIQQVMRNFGSLTLKADTIALSYTLPSPDASNEKLSAAIADLKIAQACADAVLANPIGDLLPSDADLLTGAKRDKLVSDYLSYITEFRDELFYFQQDLESLLTQSPELRNLKEAYSEYQALERVASHAHSVMSQDSSGKTRRR